MNQPIPDTEGRKEFSPHPDLALCLEELQCLVLLARRQCRESSPSSFRFLDQTLVRLRWLQVQLHYRGLCPLTSQRLGPFLESLRPQ
jgi:hypothetical protein